MDSQWLPSKKAVVRWACLPPELLTIISDGLQNAADIIRFRSVCRSWRLSTPPLPNKVSPFFPLTVPYTTFFSPPRDGDPSYLGMDIEITAGSVYLLRPRRDARKARMVHVQEVAGGKFVLRHAVTLREIPGGNSLDLSSDEWSSATPIARSYAHVRTCGHCKGMEMSLKVGFLVSNFSDPKSGSNHLVRLGSERSCIRRMFALIRGGGGGERTITRNKRILSDWGIVDLVSFKGRIYAIEVHGRLYVLDHSKLKLVQLNRGLKLGLRGESSTKRLVVWDGDLYVVLKYYYPMEKNKQDPCPPPPECYRIVVEGGDGMNARKCKFDKVEDLGDGVLFITRDCTFSVSARDLPRPWRGNSIVFFWGASFSCLCWHWQIQVFQLGDAQVRPISSLKGYSDLFAPPLTPNARS